MNETPETDALVASINSDTDIVRHEHDFCEMTWLARRLERERDEARNELLKCNEYNDELYRKLKQK